MIERVDCRFRVRWQELKNGVEEGEKVGENELGWKRDWFVDGNDVLRFYQRSVWQIAVVGQPVGMMWEGSDLRFCVGCY